MAMNIFDGRPYYSVALLNAAGDAMENVQVTAGAVINDSTIHQALASFIGLDHQVDGYVPGPCTSLRIEIVEDSFTIIAPPA